MPRKIAEGLMSRMLDGDLNPLLVCVHRLHDTLRLEVRKDGQGVVYYKKCRILELPSLGIDVKYFEGQMPTLSPQDIAAAPELYFEFILPLVDRWLERHRKDEFHTQQRIAHANQHGADRFVILDMEYNFDQSGIPKCQRCKRAGFDLLGMERGSGAIILFEVKKGLGALRGRAGLRSHIEDFEGLLCLSENRHVYRANLVRDVANIVADKIRLGLIAPIDLSQLRPEAEVELNFVYEPTGDEKDSYARIFASEVEASGTSRSYQTHFVSATDHKLA